MVVDDGLATGVSARAALRAVRARDPAMLVLAVPVGPSDADVVIGEDADVVVVEQQPPRLSSVGQWYDDFTQTPDDTVVRVLRQAWG